MTSTYEYEGYVKYADDTVVSLQCFEGRHAECPAEDLRGGRPALDGYWCECPGCPNRNEEDAAAEEARQDASALDQIAGIMGGWLELFTIRPLPRHLRDIARVLADNGRLDYAAEDEGCTCCQVRSRTVWPAGDQSECARCGHLSSSHTGKEVT